MDVDGTLTDGGIYMDGRGGELKRFDVQDGYGIVSLLRRGVKVVFISGRLSEPTLQRAQNLNVTRCMTGVTDKLAALKGLAAEFSLDRSEIAFAGDDIPDLDAVAWAGLGIAVANACAGLKAAADMVTEKNGGGGAIRECAERIAQLNGESL